MSLTFEGPSLQSRVTNAVFGGRGCTFPLGFILTARHSYKTHKLFQMPGSGSTLCRNRIFCSLGTFPGTVRPALVCTSSFLLLLLLLLGMAVPWLGSRCSRTSLKLQRFSSGAKPGSGGLSRLLGLEHTWPWAAPHLQLPSHSSFLKLCIAPVLSSCPGPSAQS